MRTRATTEYCPPEGGHAAPPGTGGHAGRPERGPSQRLSSVAIWAFSVSLGLATAALVLRGPLHGAPAVRELLPAGGMFAVFCILWAAVAWAPVSLHHRGNTYLFVLDAVPLLLGLVFLSPWLLVLGCVCAEGFMAVAVRRQSPIKVAFNLASVGLGAALAALIFRELLAMHSPVSLRGWAASAAALLAVSLTLAVNLRIVTQLAGQTPERRTGSQLTIQGLLTGANVCLAIVVLDTVWFDSWAAVPLLLVAALIIVAYRAYARLTLRFASLQRLYTFSRALGTASLEPSSMSVDVLRQVCTVMRARRAELVLAEPSGIPRRIVFDEHGPSGIEPISLEESSFVTAAIRTGTASVHSATTEGRQAARDPIAGDYRAAVVAPLMSEQTAIGAVVALDRDEELDSFDDDDLRLFETLVAHASTSLERARLVEELRYEVDSKSHQATHDMLTGLPNRMLFVTRAASALSEAEGVAIVLLDLDRFKDINDTLGHAIGDRLLCEISERLLRTVSGRATVARLGGDEFALVIADVTDAQGALAMAHDIQSEINRPIKMDGVTLAVTASAGIALAPGHGRDVALLLQRADIAMYLAKEHRGTVEVYSVEQDRSMRRRLMLGGLLTHALEEHGTPSEQTGLRAPGEQSASVPPFGQSLPNGLSVVYQPIADVRSRRIDRVEVLARWNHPVHGAIPPEEFIGIAEQMGLISQITDFVLTEACAQLAAWHRSGLEVGLAVNISGREFADAGLVDRVATHLRNNGLAPDVLTLEVTETEIVADLGQASQVLDQLAALGIKLAIDDYGTGYSSLAYLHRLPVQELKIDKSFVTNLPNDLSNKIIVRSSIAMAHSLGLIVIAEGAEDEVTCATLAAAQCDSIQGYYLSKPKSGTELGAWLASGPSLEFTPLSRDETSWMSDEPPVLTPLGPGRAP